MPNCLFVNSTNETAPITIGKITYTKSNPFSAIFENPNIIPTHERTHKINEITSKG